MKKSKYKKLGVLLAIILVIVGVGTITTMIINGQDKIEKKELNIVTSFYPIYVATANVVDGMEHINLVNLMEQQEGCVHDYQLSTTDMRKLEEADVFIMNGAGMEGYIEDIVKAYPNLTIIDSSKGVSLLEGIEHDHTHEEEAGHEHEEETDHEHEEETDHAHEEETDHAHEESEEHDHGEYNSHIWLDFDNYMTQIRNIEEGLKTVDPDHAEEYVENAQQYISNVEEVKEEFSVLTDVNNKEVIIFHDAFAYLAKMLGVDVVYEVSVDTETTLSAGEIADVIDEIRAHDIKVLLTELQLSETIADRIASETGAKVYVIDSLVSGSFDKDAYLKGQRANLEVLKEALQ